MSGPVNPEARGGAAGALWSVFFTGPARVKHQTMAPLTGSLRAARHAKQLGQLVVWVGMVIRERERFLEPTCRRTRTLRFQAYKNNDFLNSTEAPGRPAAVPRRSRPRGLSRWCSFARHGLALRSASSAACYQEAPIIDGSQGFRPSDPQSCELISLV